MSSPENKPFPSEVEQRMLIVTRALQDLMEAIGKERAVASIEISNAKGELEKLKKEIADLKKLIPKSKLKPKST